MSGVAPASGTLGPLQRPPTVTVAVTMLWAAWLLSATALGVNQLVFEGTGIGPGPALGIVSLVLQAFVCLGVGRGSRLARAGAIAFAALAVLPLQMVARLFWSDAIFSAIYTLLGFTFKAIGAALLFSNGSNRWFRAVDGRRL